MNSMKNALPLKSVGVLVFVVYAFVCDAFEKRFSEQARCNKSVS